MKEVPFDTISCASLEIGIRFSFIAIPHIGHRNAWVHLKKVYQIVQPYLTK
jgi:hypothetical protein